MVANDNKDTVQTLSALIGRAQLQSAMGMSYNGRRDLYSALGYPKSDEIKYQDYVAKYLREGIAGAVINRPAKATWRGPVSVTEKTEMEKSPFENSYQELENTIQLKSKFLRADKLSGIGTYSVLMLGLSDVNQVEDFRQPVIPSNNLNLLYVKPFGQENAVIHLFDNNPSSERFGLPEIYQITITNPATRASSVLYVHHSRVLHITRELLENEVEGVPTLKRIYNRLMDLEKLVGGSAEMFWRGARPGMQSKVDQDYSLGPEERQKLEEQLDEYDHDLRRFFVAKGVNIESLQQQVADPSNHFDIQLQVISSETGIPKRILSGSERGEMASTQDRTAWLEMIQDRREEFAEPAIIRKFVDKLIMYKVMPKPNGGDYVVDWKDLFAPSEKEQAEVGGIRADALKAYAQSTASQYLTFEKFAKHFLGLSQDVVDKIVEEQAEAMAEEEAFNQEGEE